MAVLRLFCDEGFEEGEIEVVHEGVKLLVGTGDHDTQVVCAVRTMCPTSLHCELSVDLPCPAHPHLSSMADAGPILQASLERLLHKTNPGRTTPTSFHLEASLQAVIVNS